MKRFRPSVTPVDKALSTLGKLGDALNSSIRTSLRKDRVKHVNGRSKYVSRLPDGLEVGLTGALANSSRSIAAGDCNIRNANAIAGHVRRLTKLLAMRSHGSVAHPHIVRALVSTQHSLGVFLTRQLDDAGAPSHHSKLLTVPATRTRGRPAAPAVVASTTAQSNTGLLAAKVLACVGDLSVPQLRGAVRQDQVLPVLASLSRAADRGHLRPPQVARALWVTQKYKGARPGIYRAFLRALGLGPGTGRGSAPGNTAGINPGNTVIDDGTSAMHSPQQGQPSDSGSDSPSTQHPLLQLDMNQLGHVAKAVAEVPGKRSAGETQRQLQAIIRALGMKIRAEAAGTSSASDGRQMGAPPPDWPWMGVLLCLQACARAHMVEIEGAGLLRETMTLTKGRLDMQPDSQTLARMIVSLCVGMDGTQVTRELGRKWEQSVSQRKHEGGNGLKANVSDLKAGSSEGLRRPLPLGRGTDLGWYISLGACLGRLQRTEENATKEHNSREQRSMSLSLAQWSHALLSVRQAGLVCPTLVEQALDKFDEGLAKGGRAPAPEVLCSLAVALLKGFTLTGELREQDAMLLASHAASLHAKAEAEAEAGAGVGAANKNAHGSGRSRDVGSNVIRGDSSGTVDDRVELNGRDELDYAVEDAAFFLRRNVSRELDCLVSIEMFLAGSVGGENGGHGVQRLQPDHGVSLLQAVSESPVELPLLRARLVECLPKWAPRLTHSSLAGAALTLAAIGSGGDLPGLSSVVAAARGGMARHLSEQEDGERPRGDDGQVEVVEIENTAYRPGGKGGDESALKNGKRTRPKDRTQRDRNVTLEAAVSSAWMAVEGELTSRARAAAALALDDVALGRTPGNSDRRRDGEQFAASLDGRSAQEGRRSQRGSAKVQVPALASRRDNAVVAGRARGVIPLGVLAASYTALATSRCWDRGSLDALYAVADAIGNLPDRDVARASTMTLRRIHAASMQILHSSDDGAQSALLLVGNKVPWYAAAEAVGGYGARVLGARTSIGRTLWGQVGKEAGAFRLVAPAGALDVFSEATSALGMPELLSAAGGAGTLVDTSLGSASRTLVDASLGSASLVVSTNQQRRAALDHVEACMKHLVESGALGDEDEVGDGDGDGDEVHVDASDQGEDQDHDQDGEKVHSVDLLARAFGFRGADDLALASVAFAGEQSVKFPGGRPHGAAAQLQGQIVAGIRRPSGFRLTLCSPAGLGIEMETDGKSMLPGELADKIGALHGGASQSFPDDDPEGHASAWMSIFEEDGVGAEHRPLMQSGSAEYASPFPWNTQHPVERSTAQGRSEATHIPDSWGARRCQSGVLSGSDQGSDLEVPLRGAILSDGIWVDIALPRSRTAVLMPGWREEQPRPLDQIKTLGRLDTELGQAGRSPHDSAEGGGDETDADILRAVATITSSSAFHRVPRPGLHARMKLLQVQGWAVVVVPESIWILASGTVRPLFPRFLVEEGEATAVLQSAGGRRVLLALVREGRRRRDALVRRLLG